MGKSTPEQQRNQRAASYRPKYLPIWMAEVREKKRTALTADWTWRLAAWEQAFLDCRDNGNLHQAAGILARIAQLEKERAAEEQRGVEPAKPKTTASEKVRRFLKGEA